MILNVVTPRGAKFENLEIRSVTLPGEVGEMQILPGHEALMAALKIGVMRIEDAGGKHYTAAVSGGYVEVLGDTVSCLVETCESPEEIDLERAKQKLEEAQERLKALDPGTREYQSAIQSKEKAELRIALKKQFLKQG